LNSVAVPGDQAVGDGECSTVQDAAPTTPDDQVGQDDRGAVADAEDRKGEVGIASPDGDPLARPGDGERLLDIEPSAALSRSRERDRPDKARGEGDPGALRIVDRLAQGALRAVADPIARVRHTVDHPVAGGLAQAR